MSQSVKKFNRLTGTVGIEEVEKLASLAKEEGQTQLYKRLTAGLEEAKKYEAVTFNPGALALEEVPAIDLAGLDLIPPYISAEDFTGLNKAVSPDEIYQYITDLMINTIKKVGNLPWQRSWKKTAFSDGDQAINFESKKGYRGINFFLLNFEVKKDEKGEKYLASRTFKNPYFLTFNQIEKNKGKLNKGAKGTRVVYFTQMYTHSETQPDGSKLEIFTYNKKKFLAWIIKNQDKLKILKNKAWTVERLSNNYIPILKYYNVFHAEDVTGIDWGILPKNENAEKSDAEKIEIAEAILKAMPTPPKVNFGGNQPAYYPGTDSILIPAMDKFNSPQEFYSTMFHELVHSTGHKKRLSRPGITLGRLATKLDYAKEELVAEMGAVFLCAESGILFHIIDNSATYLRGWNSRLVKSMEEDNRFYFRAASAAQAAADFMLDRNKDGIPAYRKELGKKGMPASTPKKNVTREPSKKEVPAKVEKKKLTKAELEAANPEPKAVKPKSVSVKNAVSDIIALEKFNFKEVSPLKANLVFNLFKNADLSEGDISIDNASDYAIGVLKNDGPFHSYFESNQEIELSSLGVEFVQAVKNRLESLRNQKHNYALFDGLAATAQNKDTVKFNKELLEVKRNGLKPAKIFHLGKAKGETAKIVGNKEMTLTGAVLKKSMCKNKDHCLRYDHLINLPDKLNYPLAIYKSKTDGGYVVLTEIMNELNKPIMGVIRFDRRFKVNSIKSLYSRSNTKIYQKWEKEGLLLYANKKSDLASRVFSSTMPDSLAKPLITGNKITKTKPANKKSGLKSPDIEINNPNIEIIEPKTTAGAPSIGGSLRPPLSGKHPKVKSIRHEAVKNPMFAINGETGKFLQAVEKKPEGSVVVTLDGEQGAGKTTALYKFQNDFATAGNRCLFASLEEHPSSNLATDKRDKYLTPQAQENIDTVGSFDSYVEFVEICQNYDAIFIDSWQKLLGMIGTIRLDEEVRKKFDGKVFFIIFQQTVDGKTKGGASIVFDGDIITKMVKMPTFAENYAFFDKNRYTTVPIETLKYMIAEGKTIIEGEAEATPEPQVLAMEQENEETYNFEVY